MFTLSHTTSPGARVKVRHVAATAKTGTGQYLDSEDLDSWAATAAENGTWELDLPFVRHPEVLLVTEQPRDGRATTRAVRVTATDGPGTYDLDDLATAHPAATVPADGARMLLRSFVDFRTMADGPTAAQGTTGPGTLDPHQLYDRADLAPGAQTSVITDGLFRTRFDEEDGLQGVILLLTGEAQPLSGRISMCWGEQYNEHLNWPTTGWYADAHCEVVGTTGSGWAIYIWIGDDGSGHAGRYEIRSFLTGEPAILWSTDLDSHPEPGSVFAFEWDQAGYLKFFKDDELLWSGDGLAEQAVPADDLQAVAWLTRSDDMSVPRSATLRWGAYGPAGVRVGPDGDVVSFPATGALADLADVSKAPATDGSTLVWDGESGKWAPVAP